MGVHLGFATPSKEYPARREVHTISHSRTIKCSRPVALALIVIQADNGFIRIIMEIVTFIRCMEIYCYNTEAGNHNGYFWGK